MKNLCRAPLCRIRGAACALWVAAGCSKGPADAGTGAVPGPPRPTRATGASPLTGKVVSADPKKGVLVVSHDEVKGYMPAMTMQALHIYPGDASAASDGGEDPRDASSREGQEGTSASRPSVRRRQGHPGGLGRRGRPDAPPGHDREGRRGLQRGRREGAPVRALRPERPRGRQRRFRGKQIMLNFIYSRCPVANMCPLSTAKMMATQKLAVESGHMLATGQRE